MKIKIDKKNLVITIPVSKIKDLLCDKEEVKPEEVKPAEPTETVISPETTATI